MDEKFFKELLFALDGSLACLLSSVVLTPHFAFARWNAERRVWNGWCLHLFSCCSQPEREIG
jgi:hypothetical protein